MRINLKFIYLFLILFLNISLKSQFYISGEEASNIKWNQIKTDHFSIVFPDYADSVAQNFANYLEKAYLPVSEGLKHNPKKIDVLMHMEASTSNGMVVWAPKRMEIYNTPPQDIYAQDWFEQLALHEFRHVVQVDKLNIGLTKVLNFIFGQQASGLILGAYIPLWLLEGDAIVAETIHSNAGRGRLPDFSKDFRAQVLEGIDYQYAKMKLGSYKDYVPNHYVLGYHLTATAMTDFSEDVWANAFEFTGKNPYSIFPLSFSLKKQTSYNQTGLYDYTVNKLDSLWKHQMKSENYSEADTLIHPNEKNYTNYSLSSAVNDSAIFSLKYGIDDIPRFIINQNGKSKIIHTPGNSTYDKIILKDSVIYWTEREYDLRWSHRKYNVIKKLDLKSGKAQRITKKTRYYSPDLNHDGSKIICVEINEKSEFFLVVLDAKSSEIIKKIKLENIVKTPIWGKNDSEIFYIDLDPKKGLGIKKLYIESNKITTILEHSFNQIHQPKFFDDYILFISSYSGINNPYAIELESKKIYQIASVKYDASNISIINQNEIIIDNYTAKGIIPLKIKIDKNAWIPISNIENNFVYLLETLQSDSIYNLQTDSFVFVKYPVKKYSKALHLFNFHSWGPINIDVDNTTVSPGFQLQSQNLLGSALVSLGYKRDIIEKNGEFYLDFEYNGFYPKLKYKTSLADRIGTINYANDSTSNFDFQEYSNSFNISQPFNFTKGKYFRRLNLNLNISDIKLIIPAEVDNSFPRGNITTLNYSVYFHNLLKTSQRDLMSRWGQAFNVGYAHSISTDISFGDIFYAESFFYFPGLFKHHHFKLYAAYEKRNRGDYFYNHKISFPTAYTFMRNVDEKESFSLKFNYKFPIFYPDWNIYNLIYIKRFKGGLFTDYTFTENYGVYKAMGFDLTMDFHIFNTLLPIEIGLKPVYFPDFNSWEYIFLYGVSVDF